MIHLDSAHRVAVVCILLFGLVTLYVSFFTDAFINRRRIASLPTRNEQAKAIPLWVGLIAGLGMACVGFSIDVLFIHQGLFR